MTTHGPAPATLLDLTRYGGQAGGTPVTLQDIAVLRMALIEAKDRIRGDCTHQWADKYPIPHGRTRTANQKCRVCSAVRARPGA